MYFIIITGLSDYTDILDLSLFWTEVSFEGCHPVKWQWLFLENWGSEWSGTDRYFLWEGLFFASYMHCGLLSDVRQ